MYRLIKMNWIENYEQYDIYENYDQYDIYDCSKLRQIIQARPLIRILPNKNMLDHVSVRSRLHNMRGGPPRSRESDSHVVSSSLRVLRY